MTFADYMAAVNAQKICDEIEANRPGEADPPPERDMEAMSEREKQEADALKISEAEYMWQRERDARRRKEMEEASSDGEGWTYLAEALLKDDDE